MEKKLKLTFCGGVTTVTGANYLLESMPEDGEAGVKILIDCGLEQGADMSEKNNRKFPYDPGGIDYLLVTHAHIDHIGLIPKLVKEGFKGKIFSTPCTKALAPLMLEDTLKIHGRGAETPNQPQYFDESDIVRTMALWHEMPYYVDTKLHGGFTVYPKNSGHILGSAILEISYNGKKIVFSGDLGNSPSPLLKDTDFINDASYLVMESVYGDRNHESSEERKDKLEDIIEDAVASGGALVIPSFSLEKTQVILHEINDLVEHKRVPEVPIFLDSPLAIKVTEVYKKFSRAFNEDVQKEIASGDDIFSFKNLKFIRTAEESKKIAEVPNPKIIIAGSGMSSGGRVIFHEMAHLPDPRSTVLLPGYQSPGTLGRRLQNGDKYVSILGRRIPVRARVEIIEGYSSHKDSEHLVEFVSNTRDTLKKVFTVMGEPRSALFLTQRLRDYLGVDAYHPKDGEIFLLDF